MTSVTSVGFLGVGTIAAALLRGLRAGRPDLRFHLSPRSEAVGRALADEGGRVTREPSNAAVVEASDVVVLAMLPTQLDAAVAGLPFRADQIVASCVAGTPLDQLRALVAPARPCRLVPLPAAARREGPVLLHPALPAMRDLLAGLGDLIEPPDEAALSAYVAGSAMMSSILALQNAAADWMAARGGAPADAATYVRSLFRAVSETAARAPADDGPALVARHETPGGLNARVRAQLEAEGWFEAPGRAFDAIRGLSRHDLKR